MVTKIYETRIQCPVQKLWDFHSNADALKILTPADTEIKVISTNNTVREGAVHTIKAKQFGLWMTWKVQIKNVQAPYGFTDVALKCPMKSWTHKHEFIDDEGDSILRDTITYEPPGGLIRKMINAMMVEDRVDALFKYRHHTARTMLETTAAHLNSALIDVKHGYVSDFELDTETEPVQ
ncbi:MAG: SRPBCC family protein [Fimbriimonadaceae bacterium]|nr:SRPBCC family protein [Fimbriimonadaceae bacterium]